MTHVFIGGDQWVAGVPARDLTDEEWDALTDDQQAQAQPLYREQEADTKGGE
jgi:hypothetical protein